MSIQVNPNVSRADWETLLSKLDAATKTASAQVGAQPLDRSVTVSAVGASATGDVVASAAPEDLNEPGVVDQTDIDSLCDKLSDGDSFGMSAEDVQAVHGTFTGMLGAAAPSLTSASESRSAMFDLYKLMALLVEVGQKQRDAAREARRTESEQLQTAICNQADQQRTAAWNSMIAGVICCVVQIAVSFAMMKKQGGAFEKQMGTLETTGVSSAKENLSMMRAADTPDTAAAQLQKVGKAVGDHPAGNGTVRSEVEAGFDHSGKPDADPVRAYESKTAALKNAKELRASLEGPLTGRKAPDGKPDAPPNAELRRAQNSLADFDRLDELKKKPSLTDPKEVAEKAELETRLQGKTRAGLVQDVDRAKTARQTALDNAKSDVTRLENEVEGARPQYRSAVEADLRRFEDEYQNALDARSEVENPPEDQAARLDADVKLAAEKLRYARAFAFEKLAKDGVTTPSERAAAIHDAGLRVDHARTVRQGDETFLAASRRQQVLETRLGFVNTIGNVVQGVISNVSNLIQAKTKEDEAQQAKTQEELDQTKDLFQQAQDLVDAVIKLMQAVGSAESQSMRDAIQA